MPNQSNCTSDLHKSQPPVGLSYVNELLNSVDVDELAELIVERRKNGRPGYSPRAMLRAWLSKFFLPHVDFNTELVQELKRSKGLRRVCGFGDEAPSETAICRFYKMLAEDYPDLLEDCIAQVVELTRDEYYPDLGEQVAADGTAIEAHANPNRTVVRDPDAAKGVRTTARGEDGQTTKKYFGYKLHVLSDANHDVPLAMILTPANESEQHMLMALYEKARDTYDWFKPTHVIGDKGYDSEANNRYVIEQGATPVIDINKPTAHDGMYDGIYNGKGKPTCMGMKGMTYVRTDPETGHHLYRCRHKGCHLLTEGTKAITHCDTEEWFDPEDNPRVMGPLPRHTDEWKTIYKKRMTIERMFGRCKQDRLLEGHLFLKMAKIRLHTILSMLTYAATVLTRLRLGVPEKHVRKMKVKLAA